MIIKTKRIDLGDGDYLFLWVLCIIVATILVRDMIAPFHLDGVLPDKVAHSLKSYGEHLDEYVIPYLQMWESYYRIAGIVQGKDYYKWWGKYKKPDWVRRDYEKIRHETKN